MMANPTVRTAKWEEEQAAMAVQQVEMAGSMGEAVVLLVGGEMVPLVVA